MSWPLTQTQATWESRVFPDAQVGIYSQIASGRLFASGPAIEAIYYSDDEGQSWTLASTPSLANRGPYHILELNSGRLITGGDPFTESTIIYSDDGGVTWQYMLTAPTGGFDTMGTFVQFPSGRIIGSRETTFVSDDDAQTWTQVLSSGFQTLRIVGDGRVLGFGYGDAIMYSDDEGDTWSFSRGTGLSGVGNFVTGNVAYYSDTNRVLVRSSDDTGIYISTDNGSTWAVLSNFGAEDGYMFSSRGLLLYIRDSEIIYSSDQGDTWEDAGDPPPHSAFTEFPGIVLASGLFLVHVPSETLFAVQTDYPNPVLIPPPWWTGYEGATEVRRA